MGRIMPLVPRVLRGYPSTVEALEEPETLILLGLRCWVADLQRGADRRPRLRAATATAGVPEAAASIDMIMRIVARTARRAVEMACPCCPRIAPDEQRLLHAARLAQGREAGLAEETLRDGLLSAAGAAFALEPLEGLGRVLAGAGLMLPPRSLTELVQVVPDDMTPWLPPGASLH